MTTTDPIDPIDPIGLPVSPIRRTPVDQATRDLVSRDGLTQTLFVEAGAGTGKTTQLVDRITNLVLREGVRLVNVAAITFTEAAAAELQARIRVNFERRAASADDDEVRQRCLDALADADLAAISTLHGFASRLLNEFAIDAGLPPRISVLDEVSSQLAHEDRWARFVDGLHADPSHAALLERAYLVGVALEPRYAGHATLKDVAAELNDNWDRLGPIVAIDAPPIVAPDFGAFDRAVGELAAIVDECTDTTDLLLRRIIDDLLPEMHRLADTADADVKLQLLAQASREPWGTGRGGKRGCWNVDVATVKDLVRAVGAAATTVVADAADAVLRNLLALVAGEVQAAARQRQVEGGLEFHDLLVLAREMLRTSADARAGLHERYTHILLDEFQDTDPIQIELAMRIAASITGGEAAAWQELDVDDGRLFFVGDPKQSIYRFRRADIELFLDARNRFGPDGTWARLTTNFRTVAPVLEWVNAYFGSVMATEQAGKQPRYEPLSPWRDASPFADHRPVLLGGPHPDPKVKAGELRALEAESVAAAIDDVRARPRSWPVKDETSDRDGDGDGDGDRWRPAALRDITILVPTRTSVPYLRAALEEHAIPYRLATGTLVYATQEVRDLLDTMRAIDDPTDELALVAALRSPLYACSDVDLFTFRRAGGRWDLRRDHGHTEAPTGSDELPAPPLVADHPVLVAMAHLRSLWEQRWWLSPSAMLERLVRERRAFLLGFGDPRPTEVWRRLRFLIDQARVFEAADGGDLRAFLEWASLQGVDGAKVHEPLLPETDDDAVQILTIHGAKGLEFPITILSGMTTRTAGPRNGVSLVWNGDHPEVRMRKGLATANHEPRFDLELEMDVHEKVRLLYVAATRARDHLIVSCHHKATTRPDTYASQLWSYFGGHPELWHAIDDEPDPAVSGLEVTSPPGPVADAPAPVAEPATAEDVDARERWITEREAMLAPHRLPRVVSATSVAHAAASGATDTDTDIDVDADLDLDLDGSDEDPTAGSAVAPHRRGRTGSAIGRAVHATLEVIDFAEPLDLDAQVRRQCELEAVEDLADQAAAMVRSALASDAVRLAATSTHHRELYVAAPVGGRVIEGYIDLLVETPEGLVIVDYKTDSVATESDVDTKLATYELQGAAYAVALEESTGLTVVDVRFVFCRAGGAIERSVTDLRAATARVRGMLVDRAPGAGDPDLVS